MICREYKNGCLGTIYKILFLYFWNIRTPYMDKPIFAGVTCSMITAILKCNNFYVLVRQHGFMEWEAVS